MRRYIYIHGSPDLAEMGCLAPMAVSACAMPTLLICSTGFLPYGRRYYRGLKRLAEWAEAAFVHCYAAITPLPGKRRRPRAVVFRFDEYRGKQAFPLNGNTRLGAGFRRERSAGWPVIRKRRFHPAGLAGLRQTPGEQPAISATGCRADGWKARKFPVAANAAGHPGWSSKPVTRHRSATD